MAANPTTEAAGNLADLKRKLIVRMGIAAAMIAALLGGLALFDYLGSGAENEPEAARYTEPVPVARKAITQPVTPITAAPETREEAKPPAAPEVTTAPADKSVPKLDVPQRPESMAPSGCGKLPHAGQRGVASAGSVGSLVSKPAESRNNPVERESTVVRSEPVPASLPPAPARLFSGFALQAGVFADPRRAEELHARLTLEGIPSTIEARVQVGPFKNREEADAARLKMKALGIDAVLLPPAKARR